MHISELDFEYPEALVAAQPTRPSRVMRTHLSEAFFPEEISIPELLSSIPSGDLLVVNDTKVVPRRLFSETAEILFTDEIEPNVWQVLFPARDRKVGEVLRLPGGIFAELLQKGIPQLLKVSGPLVHNYFEEYGKMPLPPYIQKLRTDRESSLEDQAWYQTEWAQERGSSAAPTASLHFSNSDFEGLKKRGVFVEKLTLHVGLGTYLPIQVQNLTEHPMHKEWVSIPAATVAAIEKRKHQGGKVWALGTTVTRALESAALGKFSHSIDGLSGPTDLLILPGFQFQVVDRLLTNFHQPRSTLLALVYGFAGKKEIVLKSYQWAMEQQFRLFSYGDLSVWIR